MRNTIIACTIAGLALSLSAAGASAQVRHRHHAPAIIVAQNDDIQSLPLTVNRRSWLDPGNSAPSGTSGPAYLQASTPNYGHSVESYSQREKFGNAALPGAPYVPGRPVPVVSFETTPDGQAYVDNVLHYQPY
jgi:hypothetical protein